MTSLWSMPFQNKNNNNKNKTNKKKQKHWSVLCFCCFLKAWTINRSSWQLMALLYFQQVSAVYAITWFPVLIIYMLNYYYKDQHYGNVTYVIAIVIVTFNSCVNPFVYAFCNGRFRSHLKKLFAFTCLKANQIRLEREKRDQTAMATTDSSNSQKRRQEFEMQI